MTTAPSVGKEEMDFEIKGRARNRSVSWLEVAALSWLSQGEIASC